MRFLPTAISMIVALTAGVARAELSADQLAKLPPAASRPVDFVKDLQPLFEAACVKCHAKGKAKGEFSLETREAFLKGGETGPGAVIGKSAESYVVELVAAFDADDAMPKKGTKWTPEQVGLLRAWIDQGAVWPDGITFAKPQPQNLHPRAVTLPQPEVHPLDRLLPSGALVVGDRVFARRVYLDLIGLLPTPAQLDEFVNDAAPDKRNKLVRTLLADNRNYADHWLTFWNDLLRNDYKGVGFIDGGRKQISGWLYNALVKNMRYDKFVSQLVNPTRESEGFTRGIIWRGSVNASMLPPMQAAQNVSQVFLGVNLKCASCHDSFVNDWSLSDAYGMAAIYADEPLELVHCDKPTGKMAAMRFLYPEIGAIDASAAKADRLKRLAEIITSREDGRLSRTIVNRLWARLLGRGLVEPLDDMDKPAWNADVLDWLAEDLVTRGFDVKQTLGIIATSRAYQLPTVEGPGEKEEYVFRGPLTKRLTAEQFSDALSSLSGDWNRLPSSLEFDFGASGIVGGLQMPKWVWTDEPGEMSKQRNAVRSARGKLAEARKKPDADAGKAEAVELASKALADEEEKLKTTTAGPLPAEGAVLPDGDRHRVVFRKTFKLAKAPAEAYGAVLGSQGFAVQVNGREAKSIQRDGFRNGRIALYNFAPLLVAGDNVVTIDIASHTEKQMNDNERKKFPQSTMHLNKRPGLAFYARCEMPGADTVQIGSDETWRVQRNPEGAWNARDFADAEWSPASLLPAGSEPIDEGPSLQPILRKDFANIPVELGPQLSTAVSTAALVGEIRASLLAADPLQVALDRPNREVVIPARATAATTMQALELTNGGTLDARMKKAAAKFAPDAARDPAAWLANLYRQAFSRDPSDTERTLALALLGPQPKPENIADLLWAVVNHPEFQLIN